MVGVCLLVAGAIVAQIPAGEFTLRWQHSVEKVRWEERYRVADQALILVEASVAGFGAGMEPGPDARLRDGRWVWQPSLAPLTELRLTASQFTRDYEICWQERCSGLKALIAPAEADIVVMRPCAAPGPNR